MTAETVADELKPRKEVPTDDEPSRWRFGMRHMLHAVFYCAVACWIYATVGAPAVVVLFAFVMTAILAFALLFARRRATQRESLLAMLALAVDRQMPLGPSLAAVSDQFSGEFRRKVRALAYYCNDGRSLPEALDGEPGALPTDAEILIRIGYESGTLSGALRECTTNRVGIRPIWTGIISRIMYMLFLLCIVQGIGGFLLYYVLPKYQAILNDFGMVIPAPMRLAVSIGDALMEWGPIYFLIAFVQVLVLLSLPLTMLGWARFELPLVHRLFRRWHAALVLRSLSWAVEGELPLTRAFETLADWYPSRGMRQRLARVQLDVQHGTDWLESLAHHRLIGRVDAAVLESARRVGNVPWALRETAESTERRLAYRLEALVQLIMPLVLLAFGALVGLLVVAYMSPLIRIIEMLA